MRQHYHWPCISVRIGMSTKICIGWKCGHMLTPWHKCIKGATKAKSECVCFLTRPHKRIPNLTRCFQLCYTGTWVDAYTGPHWSTQARTDPNWPTLAHSDPHWPTLAHTGPHWPTQTRTGPHWPTLAHSGPHRSTPFHAGLHRPTLAHICPSRPILAHTGSKHSQLRIIRIWLGFSPL